MNVGIFEEFIFFIGIFIRKSFYKVGNSRFIEVEEKGRF